jgi:hypothetical protein
MSQGAGRWVRALAVAALAAVLAAPVPPAGGGRDPATAGPGGLCADLRGDLRVACLHGDDQPPPWVDLHRLPSVEELQARTTLRSPGMAGLKVLARNAAAADPAGQGTTAAASAEGLASVPCADDGTSEHPGRRVQMVYARPATAPDRYQALLPSFRQWAAEMDRAVWLSAGETQGGRTLRFVTDGSCQVQVERVALALPQVDASGNGPADATSVNWNNMVTELQAQERFRRSNRKYMVWMDTAVGICGLGEVSDDTSADPAANWNNTGPFYARVDAPCWHYAELHEVFHMLGAVQSDARHGTPNNHCSDDADVMCYDDDGPGGIALSSTACPPEHEALLDCNHDDYFSTRPPSGSYLDTHWNTARSGFLARSARLTLAGGTTVTWHGSAGLSGRLTDQESGAGVLGGPVVLWAQRAGATGWQQAATAGGGADGSVAFAQAPEATTAYRASFGGSGTYGIATSSQVTVNVRSLVTAKRSASAINLGQTLTVTGSVSPNHAGQHVWLQRLVGGSWKDAVIATLSGSSGYTLRVKPTVRGKLTYRVYKRADSDHASATSQNLALTVR